MRKYDNNMYPKTSNSLPVDLTSIKGKELKSKCQNILMNQRINEQTPGRRTDNLIHCSNEPEEAIHGPRGTRRMHFVLPVSPQPPWRELLW